MTLVLKVINRTQKQNAGVSYKYMNVLDAQQALRYALGGFLAETKSVGLVLKMNISFKLPFKILMFSVVILLNSLSSFYLYTGFQDPKNSHNCVQCESNLW